MSTVGSFPTRDAMRRELRLARLPLRQTAILYTWCREFPTPTVLSNCQGMLDGSTIKAMTDKRLVGHRFTAHLVATTEKSSVVQKGPRWAS